MIYNRDQFRHELSILLIKWHMPTRQVAINEIIDLVERVPCCGHNCCCNRVAEEAKTKKKKK